MSADLKTTIIVFLVGWLFLTPKPLLAAYQQCQTNSSCTIGEFLFDDNYLPITNANCSLSSRYPDNSLFLNPETTTLPPSAENDGWYSHTFTTTGMPLGTYRSQICCVTNGDRLCLDKSFTITANQLTTSELESAVWNAPLSTYSNTGTFGYIVQNITGYGQSLTAADIWNHNNRSLTSFGTLAGDVWNYSSRSLTTIGSFLDGLITRSDVQNLLDRSGRTTDTALKSISNQLTEQRQLLEKIAHKPIIETIIEDGFVPDLESKISQTESYTVSFAKNTENLQRESRKLLQDWPHLSDSQVTSQISLLLGIIGTKNDLENQSLFAQTNWFKQAWTNPLTDNLDTQLNLIYDLASKLKSDTGFYGKTASSAEVQKLVVSVNSLSELVGKESDRAQKTTLHGYFKYLNYLAATLESVENETKTVLSEWDTSDSRQRERQIQSLRERLLALKLIPQPQTLGSSTNNQPSITQKNQLLNLNALIQTSRSILARFANKPVQHIYLEEGSVIFKAIVTNPSTLISQTVPLKFYLPTEIREEHIVDIDPALKFTFDPDKNSYYVAGEFTLPPGTSKVFAIKTSDIWRIDTARVESYRRQAEQLLDPLKNTTYYAQGAAVKADIDVTLDKLLASQKDNQTPEERIRAYREAEIELNGVEQKILILQELINQASNTGSILGFVGGIQSVAVWGLIIIVLAGFIYLSLYMRALHLQLNRKKSSTDHVSAASPPSLKTLINELISRSPSKTRQQRLASLIFFALISASVSAIAAGTYLKLNPPVHVSTLSASTSAANHNQPQSAPPTPAHIRPETSPSPQTLGTADTDIDYFLVKVAWGKSTNIYPTPDPTSSPIYAVKNSLIVSETDKIKDWSKIEFLDQEQLKTGWIQSNLLLPDPVR